MVNIQTVTAACTLQDTVEVVLLDSTSGSFIVKIPPAYRMRGKQIQIKLIKSATPVNPVTVTSSKGTIDGVSSIILDTLNSALILFSDGAIWALFQGGVSGGIVLDNSILLEG